MDDQFSGKHKGERNTEKRLRILLRRDNIFTILLWRHLCVVFKKNGNNKLVLVPFQRMYDIQEQLYVTFS